MAATRPALRINQPSDKHDTVITLAEQLIHQALQGRKSAGVIDRAKRSDEYYWGKHKIKLRPEKDGNKVYNKYAEIFENQVAYLTANRPKWYFAPQEENDLFTSDALNRAIGDVLWEKAEWEEKGEDTILEAAHAGSVHVKAGIAADGFPTFTVYPCESVAVDPKARKHSQLRYVVFFSSRPVNEIERDYGVKLEPENRETMGEEDAKSYDSPSLTFEKYSGSNNVSNVWSLVRRTGNGVDNLPDVLGKAVLAEIWLEDGTLEKIPFDIDEVNLEHQLMADYLNGVMPEMPQVAEDMHGQAQEDHQSHVKAHEQFLATLDPGIDVEFVTLLQEHIKTHKAQGSFQDRKRMKYPLGRIITVSQGKLLRDESNPLPLHWRELIFKTDFKKNRNYYWGKPLGTDEFDPQDDFNHRRNMVTQNINLLQNGIRKIRKHLTKGMKNVTNLVGQNVEVNHPDDLTIDFGKPLPSSHWQDLGHIEGFMDRVAGNQDVLSGRLPSADTSGVTVEKLIESGGVRYGLPLLHYASMLKKMARVAVRLCAEYLSDSQWYGILGDHENTPQIIQMIRERSGVFDIRIDVRSLTQSTRKQQEEEAFLRLQAGAYDVEAYLDKIDDPDKYKIIERMSMVNQLQAALQQATAENDMLKKNLNTMINRQQTQEGAGNAPVA